MQFEKGKYVKIVSTGVIRKITCSCKNSEGIYKYALKKEACCFRENELTEITEDENKICLQEEVKDAI